MDRRETMLAVGAALTGVALTYLGGLLLGQLTTSNTIDILGVIFAILCPMCGLGLVVGSVVWFITQNTRHSL